MGMDHAVLPISFPGTVLVPKGGRENVAKPLGGEVVGGRLRRSGSRMGKPRSAGDPWAGLAPALFVRISEGGTARAVPGVSLQPLSACRLRASATGRAGGMCLVLRAFLHCVFLAKWLLFLDPGSC